MSLNWDLTKLFNWKCFPRAAVHVLSSCVAAARPRTATFSSAVGRGNTQCCADEELAVALKVSDAQHGLNFKE